MIYSIGLLFMVVGLMVGLVTAPNVKWQRRAVAIVLYSFIIAAIGYGLQT